MLVIWNRMWKMKWIIHSWHRFYFFVYLLTCSSHKLICALASFFIFLAAYRVCKNVWRVHPPSFHNILCILHFQLNRSAATVSLSTAYGSLWRLRKLELTLFSNSEMWTFLLKMSNHWKMMNFDSERSVMLASASPCLL